MVLANPSVLAAGIVLYGPTTSPTPSLSEAMRVRRMNGRGAKDEAMEEVMEEERREKGSTGVVGEAKGRKVEEGKNKTEKEEERRR